MNEIYKSLSLKKNNLDEMFLNLSENPEQMPNKDFRLQLSTIYQIFEDEFGKINKSLKDVNGAILAISQFTLYADPASGNRPSFIDAMRPVPANELYEKFVEILNNEYQIITKKGVFGADMELNPVCDGPVTISLEF